MNTPVILILIFFSATATKSLSLQDNCNCNPNGVDIMFTEDISMNIKKISIKIDQITLLQKVACSQDTKWVLYV